MSSNLQISQHQDIRVLCVEDTIETLQRLEDRLKLVKPTAKKRVHSVDSLSLTLALADKTTPQHESIVRVCQSVARCFPKLKTLEVCLDEDLPHEDRFAIPLSALTALLHPNKGLRKLRQLTLDGVRVDANDDHMKVLVKAISKHEALKKCFLFDSSMTTLSYGRSGMEPFLAAISKKVEKLVISGCRFAPKGAVWAGSSLVKICQSNTLQELKIHSIPELKEEHIVMMSQTLAHNKHLRKLSLLKYQDMVQSLGASKHDKKKKKKRRDKSPDTLSSDAGTLALANMIKDNTVLEELCLSSFDFNEYSALFLGNALEKDNTTLMDVRLVLLEPDGGTASFPVDDPRIDYYLRLNRAGRNGVIHLLRQQADSTRALEDCSPAELRSWINTVINSKRDIDCTFYLLQNIPCLCELSK